MMMGKGGGKGGRGIVTNLTTILILSDGVWRAVVGLVNGLGQLAVRYPSCKCVQRIVRRGDWVR